MNYFEHHIGDYAADTAHLSWDEDMAYTRLIRAYYKTEKPIPLDLNEACRLARATTKGQREAVEKVLAEFFLESTDGRRQKRCDAEITKFRDKQSKAKNSANARWSNDANALRSQCEGNATALTLECEGNAPNPNPNPNPIIKEVEVEEEGRGKITFDFATGKFSGIPPDDVARWKEAYPAVDVDGQILKMAAWLMANPDKKKVRYGRFIVNWLGRKQDAGGDRTGGVIATGAGFSQAPSGGNFRGSPRPAKVERGYPEPDDLPIVKV